MERDNFVVDYPAWRHRNGFSSEPEVPSICGLRFSLQELWTAVQSLGGSRRVSEGRLWATVGRRFHPPPTMTNFSFRIKNIFAEHLLEYERSIDPDRAMLKPMEVSKNRAGKANGNARVKTESGIGRAQKRARVSAISMDIARIRDTAVVNGGYTSVSSESQTPLEFYQESLVELEQATERCEELMKLLQDAFQDAKVKAKHCHRAYEQLCGNTNTP
eukprot:g4156.t1